MSELYKTNLFLQGAPLPQGFRGTPQQWYEAMLERIRIVAPFGFSTVVIGTLKPTSNQGPWLKDGVSWYVWDEDAADYVPLDISASQLPAYYVQEADPAGTPDEDGNYRTPDNGGPADGPLGTGPGLWFRLNPAGPGIDGVFFFISGAGVSLGRKGGPTAHRPTNPANWEQYYDTTISTLVHWERGQWRTVDGCRGDLKYVSWPTAEEALSFNPGWEVYGTGESENIALRGRILTQATKNAGGGATTQLSVLGGVSERNALSLAGAETHVLTVDEIPAHDHADGNFKRLLQSTGTQTSTSTDNSPNEPNITSFGTLQSVGGGQAHNNMPPVFAVWCLRKT